MNYQRINYPNGYRKIAGPIKGCPTNFVPPQPMPMPTPTPMPMPTPTPMQTQQPMPNQNQPKLNLFPIDEGYLNGTIFQGLYQPYKNMSPIKPLLASEQEIMLFDVNKYNFGMFELGFYLNNFPEDKEALKIFNSFRIEYLKAKNAYESRFGALDWSSQQLERGPWNWVQTLAPWKRGV